MMIIETSKQTSYYCFLEKLFSISVFIEESFYSNKSNDFMMFTECRFCLLSRYHQHLFKYIFLTC